MSNDKEQKKKFIKILLLQLPGIVLILSGLGNIIADSVYSRKIGIGCLIVGVILIYSYMKLK